MMAHRRTADVNSNLENDMEALTEEVKRLRADFAKMANLHHL